MTAWSDLLGYESLPALPCPALRLSLFLQHICPHFLVSLESVLAH